MIETFQKKKNYALFDKFWYLKRSERFVELVYEGLNVDDRTGTETVHFGSLDAGNRLLYHGKGGRAGMPRTLATTMRGEHNKSVSSLEQHQQQQHQRPPSRDITPGHDNVGSGMFLAE